MQKNREEGVKSVDQRANTISSLVRLGTDEMLKLEAETDLMGSLSSLDQLAF